MSDSNKPVDVAIIGGGVAGTYSGWRLKTDGGVSSVVVYEAERHVGGRLLSVVPPGANNMVAELGGMRILPMSIQPLINTLILRLNQLVPEDPIELYDFPVNDDERLNNIVFTRGRHFRWADIKKSTRPPGRLPYTLLPHESGQSLSDLIKQAIDKINPNIAMQPTPELKRKIAQETVFNGELLRHQGFWQVLTHVISFEAYRLEQDAGGYITTLSNWNAADAIPWFLEDFGPDATYKGFAEGFRQVVVSMARLFTSAGGTIECNKKLSGFEWHSVLKYFTLHFADGDSIHADRLILALPRRSLELISYSNEQLRAARGLIESVTPSAAFKIFTTYEEPWWRFIDTAEPLSQGRSPTDLPIRQVYYWSDSKGQPITSGTAMLLASYDDGSNADYWDAFRDKSGARWGNTGLGDLGTTLKDGSADDGWVDDPPQWTDFPVPPNMSKEVARQLAALHNLDSGVLGPSATSACFKDWADDPYGGAWNFWNIGVASPDVMSKITKPDRNVPLFICGEAYSNWQGWVEGALETADTMLQTYFDVQPLAIVEITSRGFGDVTLGGALATQLEATGGCNPPYVYRWTLVEGALPGSIQSNPAGMLWGQFLVEGTFSISVVATETSSGLESRPQLFTFNVKMRS